MHINCGKAVQTLCFFGGLLTRRSVERMNHCATQWNNRIISTTNPTTNTQSFPPIKSTNYLCLNTFFTQFQQRLLLLRLIKN